jgi:hypothetical protein
VLPLLKVGIMIEWCRMFVPHGSVTKTAFWWGCVIVSFIQIGAAVATIIALNLQCIPHAAIWDFTIPNAKCFKLYNLQVSSASIQLISDICMLLLPQRVIWTLKMSWQKRMGVSVIFGLGVLYVLSLVSSFVHSRRWPLNPIPLANHALSTVPAFQLRSDWPRPSPSARPRTSCSPSARWSSGPRLR